MVREKYGEIAQNPPHFPGRLFTGVQPFSFKIPKFCFECEIPNFRQVSLEIFASLERGKQVELSIIVYTRQKWRLVVVQTMFLF